jgi:hypothetical protein
VFNFYRIGTRRNSKPATKPANVGIHRETGQVKGDGSKNVSGLTAHTRERDEILENRGHLSPELLADRPRHPDQIRGL